MTTISIQRHKPKGKAVYGEMKFAIDTELNFETLENADFIIPAGRYRVSLTWSPKFKKLLPLIEDVPNREGIRIHTGSIPEHSTGCVLTTPGAMSCLRVLFNRVEKYNAIKDENEPDEVVFIDIKDYGQQKDQ